MSVFYCDWCDQLVDSDDAPDFIYHEVSDMWQCENCIEQEDYEEDRERGEEK